MNLWNKFINYLSGGQKDSNVPIYMKNTIHVNYNKLLRERQYIYLLQEREFIKTNEPIFKIGKTKQKPLKRMSQYPKMSKIYLILNVDDCTIAEKKLIHIFDQKFIQRKDIGREYYSGNVIDMINLIMKTLY